MAYGTINAEQLTTQSGFTLGAGNASSFKNRILNGNMVIDQRNAGAVVTTESYLIDRWRVWRNQTYDIQQSTDVPTGFSNSLKITKTNSTQSTYGYLIQYIEGFNFSDMLFGTANAKTVTLSFWVKSSVTGTFAAGIINSASNRTYPATYSISSANTWEQKNVTIAGDTSGTWVSSTNGIGAGIWFNFGASGTGTANAWNAADATSGVTGNANLGTTNGATFYITGVQLEVGTVATSFDYRSYGTELALCQRYAVKYCGNYTYETVGNGFATSTTNAEIYTYFPVQMRTQPTVSGSTVAVIDGVTVFAATAIGTSVDQMNTKVGFISITVASGLTQFRPYKLSANNSTSASVIFSAEL